MHTYLRVRTTEVSGWVNMNRIGLRIFKIKASQNKGNMLQYRAFTSVRSNMTFWLVKSMLDTNHSKDTYNLHTRVYQRIMQFLYEHTCVHFKIACSTESATIRFVLRVLSTGHKNMSMANKTRVLAVHMPVCKINVHQTVSINQILL